VTAGYFPSFPLADGPGAPRSPSSNGPPPVQTGRCQVLVADDNCDCGATCTDSWTRRETNAAGHFEWRYKCTSNLCTGGDVLDPKSPPTPGTRSQPLGPVPLVTGFIAFYRSSLLGPGVWIEAYWRPNQALRIGAVCSRTKSRRMAMPRLQLQFPAAFQFRLADSQQIHGCDQGCIGGGVGTPPLLSRVRSLCPGTVSLTTSASFNDICNRQ